MVEQGNESVPAVTSLGVLLARVFWLMLGPIAAGLALLGIVRHGEGWATLVDGVFLVVVGLMLLCRWVEIRSGSAMTATGKPATVRHLRRYAVGLLVVAPILWIAANLVGNHVLTS